MDPITKEISTSIASKTIEEIDNDERMTRCEIIYDDVEYTPMKTVRSMIDRIWALKQFYQKKKIVYEEINKNKKLKTFVYKTHPKIAELLIDSNPNEKKDQQKLTVLYEMCELQTKIEQNGLKGEERDKALVNYQIELLKKFVAKK